MWATKNDAVYVRAQNKMTCRWLLEKIVYELGESPSRKMADLIEQCITHLRLKPQVIIIDEVDYLINRHRIVETLREKLKMINPAPSDFVFKFNSPKSPQQYFEGVVLRGLSIQLGIQRLFPSDLQHNFANLCLKQNIPVTFIQKSLGYYSLANFVKIYKNLIGNQEKEYYNPLDEIYNKTGLENAEK